MNNRILQKFGEQKKVIIAFVTGGDPDIATTEELMLAMAASGVDIIEIGIPFSDPVAESVAMQAADKRALEAGCTVDKLFDMVKKLRKQTQIPLLLKTYANPICAYGKDKFMAKCREVGIDGITVPDVPYEEKLEFEEDCNRYNILLILSISPSTNERIDKIAAEAKGFLYCVAPIGTAGDIYKNIKNLLIQIRKTSDIPCVVGVSDLAHVSEISAIANGVAIDNAIVQVVAKYGKECVSHAENLIKTLFGKV